MHNKIKMNYIEGILNLLKYSTDLEGNLKNQV
jgi:hypothetical protein